MQLSLFLVVVVVVVAITIIITVIIITVQTKLLLNFTVLWKILGSNFVLFPIFEILKIKTRGGHKSYV